MGSTLKAVLNVADNVVLRFVLVFVIIKWRSVVTEVRRTLLAGQTTLQVKIGLDAATNNNNAWNMYQFTPVNVELVVDYLELIID